MAAILFLAILTERTQVRTSQPPYSDSAHSNYVKTSICHLLTFDGVIISTVMRFRWLGIALDGGHSIFRHIRMQHTQIMCKQLFANFQHEMLTTLLLFTNSRNPTSLLLRNGDFHP